MAALAARAAVLVRAGDGACSRRCKGCHAHSRRGGSVTAVAWGVCWSPHAVAFCTTSTDLHCGLSDPAWHCGLSDQKYAAQGCVICLHRIAMRR